MIQENISHKFAALHPEAQRQVLDFMDSLKVRYADMRDNTKFDLSNEPFIGIWHDREDMQDSAAWVKSLRNNEWSLKND